MSPFPKGKGFPAAPPVKAPGQPAPAKRGLPPAFLKKKGAPPAAAKPGGGEKKCPTCGYQGPEAYCPKDSTRMESVVAGPNEMRRGGSDPDAM